MWFLRQKRRLILHDGPDLVVRQRRDPPGDTLVIWFSGRDGKGKWRDAPAEQVCGTVETFMAKNNMPALFFYGRRNHWWQTPEMDEVIAELRRQRILSRYRTIVTYGMSMGGYGALMFSRRLGAQRVLAGMPQYSLDGSKVPGEARWAADRQKITLRYDDMEEGLITTGEVMVLFDPLFAPDRAHVDLLRRHRPITALPVPFSIHGLGGVLSDMGILSSGVLALLREGSASARFRHRVRAARRSSPVYLSRIAQALALRGTARCRAASARLDAQAHDLLDRRAAERPSSVRSAHMAKVAARLAFIAALELKARDRHAEAAALLTSWITRLPEKHTLQLRLSLVAALGRTGERERAAQALKEAIALPACANPRQLRVLLRQIREVGAEEDALALHKRYRRILMADECLSFIFAELLLQLGRRRTAALYFQAFPAEAAGRIDFKHAWSRACGLARSAGLPEAQRLVLKMRPAAHMEPDRLRLERGLRKRFARPAANTTPREGAGADRPCP